MLSIVYSNQFKKDFKKARRLPLPDLKELFSVISRLENHGSLDIKQKNHDLSGNWNGYRECHIKPDWLLIYKITENELLLARLGSHSDLF
jgi:mRNA interferase YafQ